MRGAHGLIAGLFLVLLETLPAASESVQLVQTGGVFMLPVRINDAVVIPFVLDSSAAEVTIPADVFSTLRRSGTVSQADFMGTGAYVTADGSRHSSDRFLLHKVVVGNHVISDVVANVSPVSGSPLLGQTFLSRLPGWSIDNARHALVLNDEAGPAGAAQFRPVELADGLKYIDSKIGEGVVAERGYIVSVQYTGWLYYNGVKGTQIDTSRGRLPINFKLGTGQMIAGWDEGISGMKVGGQRTLIIPPQLAYGTKGAGGVIPPNATLIFDVELAGVR